MLKLQYFGRLMQRADTLENTLILGKIESGRRGDETGDEMVGWHHRLNGHEFEQIPRDSERLGSPCSPWGPKESDTTWQMNNILEMKKMVEMNYSFMDVADEGGRRLGEWGLGTKQQPEGALC